MNGRQPCDSCGSIRRWRMRRRPALWRVEISLPAASRAQSLYCAARRDEAIYDLRVPGWSGIELQHALKARNAAIPLILITRHGDIPMAVKAIKDKLLASAISIATGAAVGREGPIIQIGASIGSTLGQVIHLAPWQRITLVAAGAGRRNRRDLQHADRRRDVRARTDDARAERAHLPAGGARNRRRDLHRAPVFRLAARLRSAAGPLARPPGLRLFDRLDLYR